MRVLNRRRGNLLGALLFLTGCLSAPSLAPAPRDGVDIEASVDAAWDAVIEQFAEVGVPIASMERASGFISTPNLNVPSSDPALAWADCGKNGPSRIRPQRVSYNVLVRGDEQRSTVRVSARWQGTTKSVGQWVSVECVSTGVWETRAESDVKRRAEAPGPALS